MSDELFQDGKHIRADAKLVQKYADQFLMRPEYCATLADQIAKLLYSGEWEDDDGKKRKLRPREIVPLVGAMLAIAKVNLDCRKQQAYEDLIEKVDSQGSVYDDMRAARMRVMSEHGFEEFHKRLTGGNGHTRSMGDGGE